MHFFGVRFSVNDPQRFDLLRTLYAEIKRDKDREEFRSVREWEAFVANEIKSNFVWPTPEELAHWQSIRDVTVIHFGSPEQQLGDKWNFNRVFESFEEGEYDVLDCAMVQQGI